MCRSRLWPLTRSAPLFITFRQRNRVVRPLVAFEPSRCAYKSPAFWRGSFFMTVLSRAFTARNLFLPLFGRAQAPVLECENCPIVKDVLSSTAYSSMTNWALRHSGTTLVPTPPEGCWSSEAKQEQSRAVGPGQLHPAAARSGARPCARIGTYGGARPERRPPLAAQLARADPAERDPAHTRDGRPRHGRLPGEELDRHLAGGRGRGEHRAPGRRRPHLRRRPPGRA